MTDFVSVIITAYNAGKYLGEAIESVLNQSYSNFELILVNDGSKDNTLDVMKSYQTQDSRIVIDDHENMGISRSANRALKLAKGNIIVRMDADDVMKLNRIEEQVNYLKKHPEVTMLSCDAEFMNDKGETIGKQVMPGYDTPEFSREILKKYVLVACAHTGFTTYRQAILDVGGYNEHITCVVDLELFTRMVENGNTLIIMRQPLMRYRMHGNSVMADGMKNKKLQNTQDLVVTNMIRRRKGEKEFTYDEFLIELEKRPWYVKLNSSRKKNAYTYYRSAGINFGNGRYIQFVTNLSLALIMHPERFVKKGLVHFINRVRR
ncbi:MAG: glycosyltransferase family 2 protein [Microscillaceae bacterium]|nr:glycosyltransferase family 2 protein [Microscillaceae bacterium]